MYSPFCTLCITVMVYGEELVNIVELAPEPFSNQEWEIRKLAIDEHANQGPDTVLHTSDARECTALFCTHLINCHSVSFVAT